jgi:predicted acyl esterase
VEPNGHVIYITEGELALADRALAPLRDNPAWRTLRTPRTYALTSASPFPPGRPQQLTLDLLPTSVLLRAGDEIRITIAAADPDSFQLLPADGNATYTIGHSTANLSYVELPVVG